LALLSELNLGRKKPQKRGLFFAYFVTCCGYFSGVSQAQVPPASGLAFLLP
jgi:hypothetical protein